MGRDLCGAPVNTEDRGIRFRTARHCTREIGHEGRHEILLATGRSFTETEVWRGLATTSCGGEGTASADLRTGSWRQRPSKSYLVIRSRLADLLPSSLASEELGGINEHTFLRMVQNGTIEVERIGWKIFVRRTVIDAYLEAHRVQPGEIEPKGNWRTPKP